MTEGDNVEVTLKDRLLEQFRCYLDGIGEMPATSSEGDSATDLYTVFVELAGLRTEVRGESRLVKDALDQFRAVFQTMQSSQSTLEEELRRARERERALLRPLLLDILDLRDRLVAGLQPSPEPATFWLERLRRKRARQVTPWQEGLRMTLRRLDQMLRDRRVTPIELLGQHFDPRLGQVVGMRAAPGTERGIVLEEVRVGFLWEDLPLRPAEVIVSQPDAGEQI